MKIYEVGGSIRDEYLGIISHDRDYAVVANSYSEMRDYVSKTGKIYLEKPEFLTIRCQMPGLGDCDFVLARKDGAYSDARHPDTVEPGTILDDLARRDFTMNAIARDIETGEIIDPYNGIKHIRERMIHCVGNNSQAANTKHRMSEDGLRMIRALRFSTTKNMPIDRSIMEFLKDGTNFYLLAKVSDDRIKDEINKMWAHNPYSAFSDMAYYKDLFECIFYTKKVWMQATLKGR